MNSFDGLFRFSHSLLTEFSQWNGQMSTYCVANDDVEFGVFFNLIWMLWDESQCIVVVLSFLST